MDLKDTNQTDTKKAEPLIKREPQPSEEDLRKVMKGEILNI